MANPIEVQNIHSTLSSLSAAQIVIIASAVGAVIAALVAALFSLLTTWLVKRAENKRAIQELIIKSAIEMHNQDIEIAKLREGRTYIIPIDGYIIHFATVVNVLMDKKITHKNVKALLDEINKITKESNQHIEKTRLKADAENV